MVRAPERLDYFNYIRDQLENPKKHIKKLIDKTIGDPGSVPLNLMTLHELELLVDAGVVDDPKTWAAKEILKAWNVEWETPQ